MITVADVARVCHEANRALCEVLNDPSCPPQEPWDAAPDWQRTSCESGVRFKIANPGSSPEESHENWLKDKEADGWTYGEVKDPVKKTHPCFRPYAELPVEQRVKDALFQNVVAAFMSEGLIG